jgi:prophage regulatory protein
VPEHVRDVVNRDLSLRWEGEAMIELYAKIGHDAGTCADHGTAKPQRLIRLNEVRQMVCLSRASIYKRMSEGRFIKSRSLGARCAFWIEAEIDKWVAAVAAI